MNVTIMQENLLFLFKDAVYFVDFIAIGFSGCVSSNPVGQIESQVDISRNGDRK